MLLVAGIATDEGETVDGFHDLAGPTVSHVAQSVEMIACPGGEAGEVRAGFVFLAGLVILAAHDEHLAAFDMSHHAHVVIRILEVPQQHRGKCARRHRESHHVGAIGGLLGVHLHAIDEGRVGGDDHVSRADLPASVEVHGGDLAFVHPRGLHAGLDDSAARGEVARQSPQVFADVELRLARKAQRGTVKAHAGQCERIDGHQLGEARVQCRAAFASQQVDLLVPGGEQHAVDALEVAVDLGLAHDALDRVDGGAVAAGGEFRAVDAEQLLERHEAVIEHRRQVRGGAAGLAGADVEGVDHLHVVAFAS